MGSRGLPAGKVPWDLIADLVRGELPPEVLLGPAQGEDAALVRLGSETWAVASDPVSLVGEGAGRLAVTVNANDVAVRGAVPRFFTAVVLIGEEDAAAGRVAEVFREIRLECERLGVVLVGGHTEVTPGLPRSIVVGTMLGVVAGRAITTGGLGVGDRVGMTASAGLEGTAILLRERGGRLATLHPEVALPDAATWLPPDGLSVVRAARIAASNEAVTALHDVTEGGVGEALHELAEASGCDLAVQESDVPVRRETRLVCADLGIDPLGLIGSGSLLLGCRQGGAAALEAAFRDAGIPFTWLGEAVTRGSASARPRRFPRDEILKASLMDGMAAFLLDMDGTLVDSAYDWPALRLELGVAGPSLIDSLNGLSSPARERSWAALEEAERQATATAVVHEGASDLLELLHGRGLACALVTNNTAENTRTLLDRFGLRFDTVITRDEGVWKPSGAPLLEAARRLGVGLERCVKVGDSRYDLQAGREAGCGRVVLVGPRAEAWRDEADHCFATLAAFVRYLQVVLPV